MEKQNIKQAWRSTMTPDQYWRRLDDAETAAAIPAPPRPAPRPCGN
jgi:hypothetical protein